MVPRREHRALRPLDRSQPADGREASGRRARWHPPDWAIIETALRTTGHLFVTDGRVPSLTLPLVAPGPILQIVALAAIALALVRTDRSAMPRIVRVGLVYAALYGAFLVLTVSVFDAATPVDIRLLAPLVPSIVFTLAWLTLRTPIAALALVSVFAIVTLQETRTISLYGLDYRVASGARRASTASRCHRGRCARTGPLPSRTSRGARPTGCHGGSTGTPSTRTSTTRATCVISQRTRGAARPHSLSLTARFSRSHRVGLRSKPPRLSTAYAIRRRQSSPSAAAVANPRGRVRVLPTADTT